MNSQRVIAACAAAVVAAALFVNACDYRDYDDSRTYNASPGEPGAAIGARQTDRGAGAGGRGQGGAGGDDLAAVVATGPLPSGQCGALGNCDACRTCAQNAECAAPLNGCLFNVDCNQVLSCLSACYRGCGGVGECITLCSENCTANLEQTDIVNSAVQVFTCVCDSVCRFACATDEANECEAGFP